MGIKGGEQELWPVLYDAGFDKAFCLGEEQATDIKTDK